MRLVRQVGNSAIEVVDAPEPVAGAGEVLVRTAVSAICGSELKGYRTSGVPHGNGGHEAAGVVEQLGEGVLELAVGDRVGVSAIAGCGSCDECQHGRYTWCEQHSFTSNMHAELFTIPALACHLLPDDVGWDEGVLITGDGLGVPFHTSQRLARYDIDTVAVFGLGPVGLGAVLLQSFLGRRVVGVDLSRERLTLAENLGAVGTVHVTPELDVPGAVAAAFGGQAPDLCIEAAGSPITAQACFDSVRTGGTVAFNGEQGSLPLSPSEDFIRRDITALGSWFYHFSEYPEMLALLRRGLAVGDLVTHHFDVTEADAAFTTMAGSTSGKVLLTYSR
jgi:threonine dehydrogenase-like Zn-dependent dehydrogenase